LTFLILALMFLQTMPVSTKTILDFQIHVAETVMKMYEDEPVSPLLIAVFHEIKGIKNKAEALKSAGFVSTVFLPVE